MHRRCCFLDLARKRACSGHEEPRHHRDALLESRPKLKLPQQRIYKLGRELPQRERILQCIRLAFDSLFELTFDTRGILELWTERRSISSSLHEGKKKYRSEEPDLQADLVLPVR